MFYVCTTKVDFPATEAPGVPGVLHFYYKTRFSSHGSPRRTTSVLHKSTKKRKNTTVFAPRPRENPQRGYGCMSRNAKTRWFWHRANAETRWRGYVCMSKNAKTRRFWHRANAETRRGLSAPTKTSTKHDGFCTATRRLPAEGCPRPDRNVKKNDGFSTATTPKPAEGCPRTQRNVKKRRFWHRDHAETRRGLSAARKKRKKTTVLAPRPRRNPQRVVRGQKET